PGHRAGHGPGAAYLPPHHTGLPGSRLRRAGARLCGRVHHHCPADQPAWLQLSRPGTHCHLVRGGAAVLHHQYLLLGPDHLDHRQLHCAFQRTSGTGAGASADRTHHGSVSSHPATHGGAGSVANLRVSGVAGDPRRPDRSGAGESCHGSRALGPSTVTARYQMPKTIPENSVGIVTPQCLHFDEPLPLRSGKTLARYDLMVETYGTLNAQRSNAVLICHALSGDHHAAGYHSAEDEKPGWWDNCIGPGKTIDTNRFFVVCLNNLG